MHRETDCIAHLKSRIDVLEKRLAALEGVVLPEN